MTVKEFVEQIQGYYGNVYDNAVERRALAAYLADFDDGYRAALAHTVIKRHSKKWKSLPDIAVLEDCRKEARDASSAVYQAPPALPDPEDEKIISAEEFAELREKLAGLAGAKSWRKQADSQSS